MNEEILNALRNVIAYLIDEEKKHYEESSKKDRRTHIYLDVLALNQWLEEENKN